MNGSREQAFTKIVGYFNWQVINVVPIPCGILLLAGYQCRSYSLWDSSDMASSNTTNLLFLMNLLVL